MKVVMIRHAEVDLCWNRQSTSEVFDADCCRYDSASIKELMYKIPGVYSGLLTAPDSLRGIKKQ